MIRAAVVVLISASAMAAQDTLPPRTYWWFPTTIGTFALGASVGYATTALFDINALSHGQGYHRSKYRVGSWAGATVGGVVGFLIGASVDGSLRRHLPVTTFRKRAVRLATVLAGAAGGAAVSYNLFIVASGRSSVGSGTRHARNLHPDRPRRGHGVRDPACGTPET